jgi:alkylhydroperoxidase/carboxymuconolactone decarboxylase family protein YurZ
MSDWREQYLETLGKVPPVVASMYEADVEFGNAYSTTRKALYVEREGGLDLAMKELVFVVLDVMLENVRGATLHLEAAYAAGLTDEQLKETLMIIFAMCGVHTWGVTGNQVWEARAAAREAAESR